MPLNGADVFYPPSTDHVRLWEHFQTAADSMTRRLRPVFADLIARDAAYPSPAFGDEAAVVSTGEWYWHNGTAWVSKQPRWAYKTVSEDVTNNTVVQNDDHLLFGVEANARYEFDGMIWVAALSVNPDLRVQMSGPASSTITWTMTGDSLSAGVAEWAAYDAVSGTAAGTHRERPTSGAGAYGYRITGVIVTAATAGVLNTKWAQAVSGAVAARLSPNSYLKCMKYA